MRLVSALVLLVSLLVIAPVAHAQGVPPRHADVRIHLAPGETLASRLAGSGVVLDHVSRERTPDGVAYRTVLSADELAALQASGVRVDVLVADLAARHADRLARAGGCPATPFPITGSMGCYPTFAEAVAILDQMRAQYPALVSEKVSIGTTHEGRDVWMIEIGDNPGVDEGEPEVLLNALHHAREPQGLASLLHAVWTALDGYGTDPEWTYLLDHRRVFLVPVLNPDGYVFNETTNPEGGGFWRKNRRDNGGNVFGVDLNRNYGFEWGHDNSGSSPSPSSSTYRGPSPFSEPETQALRDFVSAHDIRLALNTHTWQDVLIYPWGYEESLYTPDSAAFVDAARVLTASNGYRYGTIDQTLDYIANGGADDWMYGAEGVLSFTPELGGPEDNFWPSPDRLLPIAEQNVDMYRQAIRLAGGVPSLASVTVLETNSGGNGYLDPGDLITIDVSVTNLGRTELEISGAQPSSYNPDIVVLGSLSFAGTLAPGETTFVGSYPGFIRPTAPLGNLDGLSLEVGLEGGASAALPLGPIPVGTPVQVFSDDASSLDEWEAIGGWGLTTSPVLSPPSAFSDSPAGSYLPNADAFLFLSEPLDLTHAVGTALGFSARWDIEESVDFGTVEVATSRAAVATWRALPGRFTRPSGGFGPQQPAGVPGYDGQQDMWVRERIDLSAYDGVPTLRLRFRLRADAFEERDGWFVDDIVVSRLTNGNPTAGEAGPAAAATALDAPTPNPAAGAVRVGVALGESGPVDLAVYDVLGRRVATLQAGDAAAGRSTVEWDGRDARGVPVAAGLYVLRLVAGGAVATRQVLVVR